MAGLIVAIDGPAGAGKSTVARHVAERLGYFNCDSGALYRAVALFSQRRGLPPDDSEALARLAWSLRFRFVDADGAQHLLANEEDVEDSIRMPEIGKLASIVSRVLGVRDAVTAAQRELGGGGRVVAEGRDIGTVVFPDAPVKVFLTASIAERARRRAEELRSRGFDADLAAVQREIEMRDYMDTHRPHSPLMRAEDAVALDTDGLTPEDVADRIVALCRERGA